MPTMTYPKKHPKRGYFPNPLSQKAISNLVYIGAMGSIERWEGCSFERVRVTHLDVSFLMKRELVQVTYFPGGSRNPRARLVYTLSAKGHMIYEVLK